MSKIVFIERYVVLREHSAAELFALMPCSRAHSARLVYALATSALTLVLEAHCFAQMLPLIPRDFTVVSSAVSIDHCGLAAVGEALQLTGWVQSTGERHAIFDVSALAPDQSVVCRATIKLSVVPSTFMAQHLAGKGAPEIAAVSQRLVA